MRASFKKTLGVVATAGAVSFCGPAVANAVDRDTVPDVAGMTVPDALAAFEDADFTNVSVNVKDSPDLVIGTNFQAGSKANDNAAILIIVPSR